MNHEMNKRKARRITDHLMTITIVFLMAYGLSGQLLHEIAGMAMGVLFIIHTVLNWGWYRHLFSGRMSAFRVYVVCCNLAVLTAMVLLLFSGMVLSGYIFKFLPVPGSAAISRNIHLTASYWFYLLAGIHIGNHAAAMTVSLRKSLSGHRILRNCLRAALLAVCVYGVFTFHRLDLFSYMILRNRFLFFNPSQTILGWLAQYLSMITLWICIGALLSALLKSRKHT